jgi:hypothetical protein
VDVQQMNIYSERFDDPLYIAGVDTKFGGFRELPASLLHS